MGGDADELCAMFDESSQCTIVLPEECLGYGLVVPFLACRFAPWFRIHDNERKIVAADGIRDFPSRPR